MTIHQQIAAAIDLGSNTFRLLVADCSTGNIRVLAKKLATVRLGGAIAKNGLLQDEAIQRGYDVLHSFREILAHHKPQCLRVCGTQALRRARNSRLFLQRAEEILQQAVEIITGEEEARLSLAGALWRHSPPQDGSLLLVDVGGGSTELVLAAPPAAPAGAVSVPLGVVSLTESFLAVPGLDISDLDAHIEDILKHALEVLKLAGNSPSLPIIGCGGTATSMAALAQKLTVYDESLVHGYTLTRTAMAKLWDGMIVLPADMRNNLPCLGEGRGEILPAGIRIYLVLLRLLKRDRVRVSDTGLLEGLLLSCLQPDTAAALQSETLQQSS